MFHQLLNIKQTSHSWDKSHSVVVDGSLYVWIGLACCCFFKDFCSCVSKGCWSVFFFLMMSLVLASGQYLPKHLVEFTSETIWAWTLLCFQVDHCAFQAFCCFLSRLWDYVSCQEFSQVTRSSRGLAFTVPSCDPFYFSGVVMSLLWFLSFRSLTLCFLLAILSVCQCCWSFQIHSFWLCGNSLVSSLFQFQPYFSFFFLTGLCLVCPLFQFLKVQGIDLRSF